MSYWPLVLIAPTLLLWAWFWAYTELARRGYQLTSRIVCAVGLPYDVLYNYVVGSVLFFELPHEHLFTHRLMRHVERAGYRGATARWVAEVFIYPIDPWHLK